MTITSRTVFRAAAWNGAAVLLASVLGGCPGGGTGPTGAHYTFTADGTGPTNVAPLDPLRNGTLRGELLVDGTVTLPTGRARRVINQKTAEVTYVIDSRVGLFLAGGQLDGVLQNPVLLVPSTVRVGMKWDVTLPDDQRAGYTFEVTERTEAAPSAFGKTVQWSISQTDALGAVTSRRYAEGIGIADISSGSLVIPLESPDTEPSKAPPVALELVPGTDGLYLPEAASGVAVSMVRAAGHDAVLLYDDEASQQSAAVCLKVNPSSVSPILPITGAPYARLGPEDCPAMLRVGTDMANTRLLLGGHASGAFVEADGHISWIPRKRGTIVSSGLTTVETPLDTLTARALVPGDNGHARLLFEQGLADQVKLGGTSYLYGQETEPELHLPDAFMSLTAGVAFISPLTTDEGDRGALLVRTGDEMLWLVKVSSAGMTTPVQLGRLGGTLSVQATETGHEILRVTSDGQVDRLHLRADQLSLEPLADVEVPFHMYADGAFLFRDPGGDRLLIAMFDLGAASTEHGFKLFRSVGPVVASATRTPLAVHASITSAGGNADQLICLPPGAEAISTSGWSLGDQPVGLALQVTPQARCVLLVRGAGQVAPGENLAFGAATGTLPGLGRVVLIGMSAGGPVNAYAPGVPHLLAPLTGGTVAHPSRRYGRGLVALEPRSLATEVTAGPVYGELLPMWYTPPLIDLRGDGLWAMRKSFAPDGYDVVRLGADFFHRTFVGIVELHGVSQKGGVLALVRADNDPAFHWIRQTSAAPAVDLPLPPNGGTWVTELSDGTLCGDLFDPSIDMVRKYFCVSPGGPTRTATATQDQHFFSAITMQGNAVPLPDGSLLIVGWDHLYRFDTATMTSSNYLDGQVWLGVGSDGSPWGVTVATDGAIALYRLEVAGPKLVTGPGAYRVPATGLGAEYQLTVDDDVIGVANKGPGLVTVRIPRP